MKIIMPVMEMLWPLDLADTQTFETAAGSQEEFTAKVAFEIFLNT